MYTNKQPVNPTQLPITNASIANTMATFLIFGVTIVRSGSGGRHIIVIAKANTAKIAPVINDDAISAIVGMTYSIARQRSIHLRLYEMKFHFCVKLSS